MTAAALTPSPAAPAATVSEVSRRLGGLVDDRSPVAQWWVDLVAGLDELSDRMSAETSGLWQALRRQLSTDAPYLSSRLHRIDAEAEDLQSQVLAVRILAGSSAGDPEGARTVRTAVRDLLSRLRRHEEHTSRLMVDAYVVDLGGE